MSDLLQILKQTSAKPRVTFYSGGVASDLDSGVPTVTITRPDGTTIASGTVTHVGAAGSGTYEFTYAGNADPTYLTVTWAGPIGGVTQTLTTFVEVLGGLLFNVADLRGLKFGDETPFSTLAIPLYSDQEIMDARTAVLDELEAILGFTPVPRFRRETFDGDGDVCLNLPGLHAHDVLSVTINGIAQTASNYHIGKGNQLEAVSNYGYGTAFTWGRRNVIVEWVHGWERVEGIGRHAAMKMAADQLFPDGLSSAQSVTTPDGVSYSYEPAEVGRDGYQRWTGIRKLDRWLNRHSQAGLAVA
jgi:hypothetical protein